MNDTGYEASLFSHPFPQEDLYGSISIPQYNTVAYEFETAADMEAAFCGQTDCNVYSRITNPTVQHFENCVKKITGAFNVTALNSGMAAISNVFMAIAYSGCNIVTSRHLFGNTYSFFVNTLKPFGVEIRFCDLTDEADVRKQIDENTCAIFLEIITNPQMEVADLSVLSAIAYENGVPLIADTTIVSFSVFKAKNFGVDIEVVSGTKYISGGATGLGGLIIDYATFDWLNNKRLAHLAEEHGNYTFNFKLRKEIHRNFGAYMTPQTAYMQLLGLETLNLRFMRQSETCAALAKKLLTLPQVLNVNYTTLKDNPFYEVSNRQFGAWHGAMLTFELESKEACFRCIDNVKRIRRATNLFDNKSLIIHPASTIYGTFTPEQREEMHINPNVIRLSVGLESADDLFSDIKQALE